MSSMLVHFSKGMVAMCDAYNATKESKRDDLLQAASLTNKLVLLGFTLAETNALINGAKSESLFNLKTFELLPRLFNMSLGWDHNQPTQTLAQKIRFLEKNIVAPFVDLGRVIIEGNIYYEKNFLELSPEELSETGRPIYEIDSCTDVAELVGYESVDIKECEAKVKAFQETAVKAALIRSAAEVGLVSTTVSMGKSIYERLAIFMYSCNNRPSPNDSETCETHTTSEDEAELEFDLLSLKIIPPILHEDEIFKKYICPITQVPIRNPVGDPNGRTIYEKSAIVSWLCVNPISPMTRNPLRIDQLVPKPALQLLIDHRLKFHGKRLCSYLQKNPAFIESLKMSADPRLQSAADAEMAS